MERDSEEHEEGEIIDDFEDISDYSIPSTSYSGKSVSHRDLLQDVSLSSISDSETDDLIYIDTCSAPRSRHAKRRRRSVHCRRRKRHRSHEYYPRHTLNKYISPLSETSDTNDFEVDPKMQKQLKDAIRIESSHIHHNSLRTRLKAMLQNDNVNTKTEDEEEEETLRTLALLSNTKDEVTEEPLDKKFNDQESADEKDEELIELRLAALKSAVLKKAPEIRKRKFTQHPKKGVDQGHEINKENNANQENNINEGDVKKAELQDKQEASQADIQNETSRNTSMEEDIDIMRAKLLASMSKKIAASLPKQNAITIIPREISVKPILNEKHKLLKQQIKVKPLIINLNDSDSDTDVTVKKDQEKVDKDIHLVNSVHEFLKKQRAAVEAKSKTESGKTTALDKSVVKLLSKPQQKEYHLLKQKLLLAKRKRLRKSSQKIENNNGVVNKSTECNSKDSVAQASVPKPNGLQKTLDDMQIKKDGRLQMKGKYKALELLLQNVKQASATRKQNELEIKVLLEELQKVQDKLANSHKNYSNLVHRLLSEKNVIDRRINKMHNGDIVNAIKSTSTPVKSDIQESICDISSIQVSTSDDVKELNANNENIQTEHGNGLLAGVNDIGEIPKCDNGSNALKQYVSPLDSKNRDTVENPLMTFCPYDLFGVCKDSECKFNHCSKT